MLTMNSFLEILSQWPVLLDGATGSNLRKAGMPRGCSTETWVLDHPQVILDLQSRYAKAGSRILYAPTFQAQEIALPGQNIGFDPSGRAGCPGSRRFGDPVRFPGRLGR